MNLKLQLISFSVPTELQNFSNTLSESYQKIPELDYIFERIAQGEGNTLSDLECLWCVLKKEEWDQVRSRQEAVQIHSSQQLWITATHNELLKYYLLRGYLRFYLEKQPFAVSLVETFDKFKESLPKDDITAITIQAISSIPIQGIYPIVCNSAQISWGKQEILGFIHENAGVVTIDLSEFTLEVASFFSIESQNARINPDSKNTTMSRWLVKCLNQETDILGKQVKAVETILAKVHKEDVEKYPEFIEWLKQYYQKGDLAKYLSDNAKRKLKEWIGTINFADFAKLIKLVAKSLPEMQGNRTNPQINQLFRRSYFWQNYSDKFEQVRILLPSTSERIVSNSLYNQYTVLKADCRSETTEVCVFDFNSCLIVEFFRGKDSEIRLFSCDRYPHIREILFKHTSLSISDIRRLGGEVHDHLLLWQSSCERWLYKHGISPNSGLSMFKIGDNQQYPYNLVLGINSNVSSEKLTERNRKLSYWKPPSF